MIRDAIIALALSVTPAVAQSQADIKATVGLIHVSFARIYCGMVIPKIFTDEVRIISSRNGWDALEYAEAIAKTAHEKGQRMTVRQRDAACATTLRSYRELGLQR